MGNRAVITLEDENGIDHPVALYVHWHGGLESALAFVQYTWDTFERGRDDLYTFHARLCQVIGNFFADGLSLYAYPVGEAGAIARNCDNGGWHFRVGKDGVSVPGWDAEAAKAREHEYWTREAPIQELLRQAMPRTDGLGRIHSGVAPAGVEAVS